MRTEGINPYFQDTQQIITTLQHQLLPTLGDTRPGDIFFYGTGCNSPASNTIVANALKVVFPETGVIDVQSDMLGAARGAARHQPGIVCILGTGANAATYDGAWLTSPSYSLGFWLGDEGSGGNLGKRLVTAFLHNQLPNRLAQAFTTSYGLDRLMVLDHAYNKPYPNRYFAQFAPFLSAYRDEPFVQELLQKSFADFLGLYVQRLPHHLEYSIHVVGSIGHYFDREVRQAMHTLSMKPGQFLQAPMSGLMQYHAIA
ncbi:N-acetylglucosamine kinase [Fibrella aquatilis]|uniref:N-acetylglucosamine kinase n=1 Tax=Fibrella aquatilis TaxID=2817059 RepID=UPI001E43B9ED|nr:N-acetylglucosamine kinase [Fibrella aquatilis]